MRSDDEFPGFSPVADHPEQVNRAMVLLGSRSDLRDQLRINPEPARKRPTGGWNVFNFLGSSGEFTKSPQLLLWVGYKEVSAKVILPNEAPNRLWSKLAKWKWAGPMARVLQGMAPAMADCPGMEPRLILKQRHWRTRSGPSFQDAYLDVDLRTLRGDPGSGVKEQRDWIEAAQCVVANKNKDSNFELQVGATFRYDHCPAIQAPDALNHVAAAWIGCLFFIKWLVPDAR